MAAERFALLALWACAADSDEAPAPAPVEPTATCPPAFEPGIGEFEHVPIAEGDVVPVVYPPTGFLHLQTSGRVAGMGEVISIGTALFAADGSPLASPDDPWNSYYAFLTDHDGCSGVFTDTRAHLDPDPPAGITSYCALDGATVHLEWGLSPYLVEEGELGEERVSRLEVVAAVYPEFMEMFCP